MENQLIIRSLLFAATLFVSLCGFGQTSFYKVYSGNGYDKGEGIAQLPDSGFLVTGSSSSFEEAPSQVFLMRLDSVGNFKSSKAYGGIEFEEGKRVMPLPGFGYYLAGTSSSGSSGDFDFYLLFTDEAGNQQWETRTDFGAWERVHDAILLEGDTSLVLVGETDSTSDGNTDIFMARYDKTGGLIWQKHFGGSGNDVAYAVVPATDTSVWIAGTWYREDSLQNKAYLAEIHIDGSLMWGKTYGVEGNYQLNDMCFHNGQIRGIGERIKTGKTDHDSFTVTTSPNGTMLGSEEHYSDEEARYTNLVPYTASTNNKYFMSYQLINPNTPTYPEGEDCYVSRFDSGLYWDGYGVGYNGIGQDQFNDMKATSDGFAVGVGFHTQYGGGGNSVFVVKIGDENYFPDPQTISVTNIVNVEELTVLKELSVYPNPVSDLLHVHVPQTAFGFRLTDASGKELISGTTWSDQQLDFSAQSQGIYFLTISHESGEMLTVKIIK